MDKYERAQKAYDEARAGINVKENEQIVLECKTDLSYHFAKDIKGADIKAHEQVIIEIKSSFASYAFARNIRGSNVEEHFKIILNSGNKFLFDEFIKDVNYKGTKVEEWLMYI